MSLAGSIMMLSSMKLTMLLLLLLATLFISQSAAFTLPEAEETTTAAAVDETATRTSTPASLPTTAKTTTTTKTNKMPVMGSATSQQKIKDYAKNAKILFPSTDNSEGESKFDVYGLKTTPPPKEETNKTISNTYITTETIIIETTVSDSIVNVAGNSTDIVTPSSVDDRLGILNLAPHCPEGHVVVNQRCHKSA